MKPAILIIGIILCLIGGFAVFNTTVSYTEANNCVEEHGYVDRCETAVASAGATAILSAPVFIIFGMVGIVLVGDGLK